MTAIAQALSSALLHFLWQGVVVAFLFWIVLYLLRRSSAQARYAASGLALAILAILPVITAYVLYSEPASSQPVRTLAASLPLPVSAAYANSPGPAQWIALLDSWALPVWSFGVFLFSFRLVVGCRQISLLRRRGGAADPALLTVVAALARRLGVRRAVSVLVDGRAESPSVVGWLRPAILVPAGTLMGLTAEQLEAVLAHELAHIRRHDYLVNVLQVLVETLLFYHPAVWWISAHMRHERELCCDDMAVRCCGDATCYARALTKLERLRIAAPQMALGSNSGSMLFRIQRLVGSAAQEYAPSKLPGVLALVVGVACFGYNLHSAHGQPKTPNVTHAETAPAVTDGPGVAVDLAGAALLHRGPVEYPGEAWERHIEGTVLVEVSLAADGAVSDARVMAGPAELRKPVLQSVLEWHFAPDVAGAVRRINVTFHHTTDRPAHEGPQIGANASPGVFVFQKKEYRLDSPPGDPAPEAVERERVERELAETREHLEQLQAERQAGVSQERAATIERLKQQIAEFQAERLARGKESDAQAKEDLERELAKYQEAYQGRLEQLEQTKGAAGAEQAKQELRLAEQQYAELLKRRDLQNHAPDHWESLDGRTLSRIDIVGLPEQSQNKLKGTLPVHLGDALTAEVIERVTRAVKQLDEHLEVHLNIDDKGQAELRIVAPHWRQ